MDSENKNQERSLQDETHNVTKGTQTNPTSTGAEEQDFPSMSRRSFFKRTVLGGGAAIAAGGVAVTASQASLQGKVNPKGIEVDDKIFKQMDERDTVLGFVHSKDLNDEVYPERPAQYMRLHKNDFHLHYASRGPKGPNYDNNRVGYTQLDHALNLGAGFPSKASGSRNPLELVQNENHELWDQSGVSEEKYIFGSDEEAANAMRSAGRVYGALRVGIAKFDPRFVYEPIYNRRTGKTTYWKDFPFEPKSVIVMAVGMDYDAFATAPGHVAAASSRDSYMMMSKIHAQMSEFIRKLGYKAVGAGNDLAISVAYGILAGLGEGGRNNVLIMPGIGPRARLIKIFTEYDFGDAYDQPHSWGITEFCKSCMKCADACPSGSISTAVEPSFEPNYEFSDEPGYTWNNHKGVKKWHPDAKKCYQFWVENGNNCGNCISACTFNEPDFWHHWLIMAVNPAMPKFAHSLMADAHPAFGYGGQGENVKPEKVKKFWESGKGMRTNIRNKDNHYTSGQA